MTVAGVLQAVFTFLNFSTLAKSFFSFAARSAGIWFNGSQLAANFSSNFLVAPILSSIFCFSVGFSCTLVFFSSAVSAFCFVEIWDLSFGKKNVW